MNEATNCPVCQTRAKVLGYSGGPINLECPRCGEFVFGHLAAQTIGAWSPEQRANLSGWIRENPGSKIFEPALEHLQNLRTPTVGEKAEKLLFSMIRQNPKPGTRVPLFKGSAQKRTSVATNVSTYSADVLPHVLAQSWAQDAEEVVFLVITFLILNKEFLQDADDGYFMITPEGWAYVHSVTRGLVPSDIGFIAMWFAESMNGASEVIHKAIQTAGYTPIRIDRKEHNNRIDDEIISTIRRSRFVVADFTGHRGGVYFEAGFAAGLGIPVIWMCRRDELEKLHFDTRQYSHIVWDESELPEMKVALQRRIEATLGRGPNVLAASKL